MSDVLDFTNLNLPNKCRNKALTFYQRAHFVNYQIAHPGRNFPLDILKNLCSNTSKKTNKNMFMIF